MAYSEQIQLLFSKYLHHGWRKFWISMLWNSLEQRNSTLYYFKVFSPWLKKILNFKALKWLRTNSISYYFLEVSLSRLKTNGKGALKTSIRTCEGAPWKCQSVHVNGCPWSVDHYMWRGTFEASISTCEGAPLKRRSVHVKGRPWNFD